MNKEKGLFEGLTVGDMKTIGGSIAVLIDGGLDYVAMNAVSSCYKKIDACILAACDKNPLRCIEGTSLAAISEAEKVGTDAGSSDFKTIIKMGENETALTSSHINRYLRSECADAIGGFEACHITYMGGKPKAKDLADRDIIEEVFNLAHNDRKSILASKIQGRMQEFDTAAKDACRETIRTCAMRTCGGGIGSACYSSVYGSGKDNTINAGKPYTDIKNACSAIVNTDKNCVYAYMYPTNGEEEGKKGYSYSYIGGYAFDTLFPEAGTDGYQSTNDPIGVVGELNSLLATSYNDAAIAQMKKECTNAAKGCVKALCGSEYESCYRNRTDIMSNITNTGDPSFDKSMNKVGGVLDYTVIVGLCLDTVKNNNSCHEHLAITKARFKSEFDAGTSAWGSAGKDGGVRGGWMDAGGASKVSAETEQIAARDENGNELCRNDEGEEGVCYESSCSDTKCIYDEPVMQSYTTYVESQADSTFFRDLVYDLEKEAQAKYNAKLTKLQNSCLASNGGNGIMGAGDMSSIYKWAKLKGKLPADYSNSGLKESNFTASNDLYGSFCAVKVTLHSDDQVIRDALNGALKEKVEKAVEGKYTDGGTIDLKKDSYRYFAVGDPIVCGGWLTGAQLEQIASVVEANARAQAKDGEVKGMRGWMTALGAVGLGTGGVFAGDAIQNGGTLNLGLSGNKSSSKKKVSTLQNACSNLVDNDATNSLNNGDSGTAKKHLLSAISKVEEYNNLSDKRRGEEVEVSAVRTEVRGMKTPEQLCADKSGTYKDKTCTVSGTNTSASALVKDYNDVANKVAALCDKMSEYDKDKEEGTVWANHKGKILGGIIGAGAGAGLAYAVTDAALDAKLDKAGNEAYQAFMDAIGSKIHCYIGSTEVGSYGQIIETSME